MIKFEKIKPGMTLYDVKKNTGYPRSVKWLTWPVYIISIDEEKREVVASWNHNKPRTMSEHQVTKYRAKRPI